MNEKGFAATGILYTILVLFILLVSGILVMLYSRNNLLHQIQNQVKGELSSVYPIYQNGTPMYFNPVTGNLCSEYISSNSLNEYNNGCMKWYIFNDNSTSSTVNMILDHNTTARVAWNSSGSNSEMKEVSDALANDSANWNFSVKSTARLIGADEIAQITGNSNFRGIQGNWFYFDSNTSTPNPDVTGQGTSTYAWLFDYIGSSCIQNGCNFIDANVPGYWTSTPVGGSSDRVWRIAGGGYLGDAVISRSDVGGVRPVITIDKSLIGSNTSNLIINGDLLRNDNTNFSQLKYETDLDGGYLIYTATGDANFITNTINDEYIAIDNTKAYTVSIDIRSNNPNSKYYLGLVEYDADKNPIISTNVMYIDGSLTHLTQDLNDGDTVIYLDDVSGFKVSSSTPNYQRGFIFWDYVDGTGYIYPELTYSRNYTYPWYIYTGINTSNNTIALASPWRGGFKPTGIKLSQSNSGASYNYSLVSGTTIPSEWTTYKETIKGINTTANVDHTKFRAGTKYVKLLLMVSNGQNEYTTFSIKNISLTEGEA